MTTLTLEHANKIIDVALKKGRELDLKPLTVAVLDPGGHAIALQRETGASNLRPQMAEGKARGSLNLGMGSRAIYNRALKETHFAITINALSDGNAIPLPGGALVLDGDNNIIGAVGITGDSSDNDEICVIAGIEAIGFNAKVD